MPARTILLLRHAEKPDEARGIRGVDTHGREDAAELSVAGWQRSGALPRLFSPGQAAEMLPRPDAIHAAASRPGSARPVRTVQLLADLFGLPVDARHEADDVDAVARAIRQSEGVVLVCWRHEAIAPLARRFVGDHPGVVPEWDPARFDLVWVMTTVEGRWTFRQRPQLLLPGDIREPIRAPIRAR